MPPVLFAFSYFGYKILHFAWGWPGPWPTYSHFLCSWDDRCMLPHPSFYWLIWDLQHFLLALDHGPPDLCL
jgi:hypothetical protein